MPAQVVVVLQDSAVVDAVTNAIRANGHTVQPFTDPILALAAVERAKRMALLITCVQFPPGKPNGRSLALMARQKRPGIKLIFICEPRQEQYVADLGPRLPPPVEVPKVAALAEQLLAGNQRAVNSG